MSIEIKKFHEDKRGKSYKMQLGEWQIFFVFSVKGASRGGHFHKTDQLLMVIHGSCLYKEIDPTTRKEIKKIVKAGDVVNVLAGRPHMLIALEDSLFIESRKGEYEAKDYEPYRKIVKDYLAKSN